MLVAQPALLIYLVIDDLPLTSALNSNLLPELSLND